MDLRQLVLIRQFFSEARLAPEAETPFLRIRRALHLDLCVELALNAVVRERGTAEQQNKLGARLDTRWHDLWDLADEVSRRHIEKSLPERSPLKTLHEQRNLAQHRGVAPSADEVRAAVEPVRSFLEFVCRDLFDVEFDRLREWDVLEDESLRTWLAECFEAFELGEYVLAAAGCRFAFLRIIDAVREAAGGPGTAAYYRRNFPAGSRERDRSVISAFAPLKEAIVTLEAQLLAVALGLPMRDNLRFQRLASGVLVHELAASENWRVEQGMLWPEDPEECRAGAMFMLEYLGKVSVLVESAFPGVGSRLKLGPRFRESAAWRWYFERAPVPRAGPPVD